METDDDKRKQTEMREQIAAQLSQGLEYECGDCAKSVFIKAGDQIVCDSCGYRILYKPRTKRLQQYECR